MNYTILWLSSLKCSDISNRLFFPFSISLFPPIIVRGTILKVNQHERMKFFLSSDIQFNAIKSLILGKILGKYSAKDKVSSDM